MPPPHTPPRQPVLHTLCRVALLTGLYSKCLQAPLGWEQVGLGIRGIASATPQKLHSHPASQPMQGCGVSTWLCPGCLQGPGRMAMSGAVSMRHWHSSAAPAASSEALGTLRNAGLARRAELSWLSSNCLDKPDWWHRGPGARSAGSHWLRLPLTHTPPRQSASQLCRGAFFETSCLLFTSTFQVLPTSDLQSELHGVHYDVT